MAFQLSDTLNSASPHNHTASSTNSQGGSMQLAPLLTE